ncbi:hypothetical protein LRD69_08155 [Streptomyces sp. JH14]|uniref:hypothetical protein n=1 Tax=Streptomyces sp. JH14 TaxID=2793630 RepID=UPI0023F81A39|nr:hypothetical protein [Streptomyces sp. JH14]MDF6042138.1 hypothetical protein [Streptomyces sp. JH14]
MGPKSSATYGQLMLFAALLFGISTMHTVGHPAEHHSHDAVVTVGQSAHGADAAGGTRMVPAPDGARVTAHGPDAARVTSAGPEAPGATELSAVPMEAASELASVLPAAMGGGMDSMAACLAVLGTWGAVLAACLMALRPTDRLRQAACAPLSRALWPSHLSGRTVLARSSVLRI